jgi:hypothetical protein
MDDDITGDGRADILVTSPWGLGILGLSGGSFGQRMIAANGTRFGGWLLNTADNVFPMLADLDGDGREEIVVTSPWGVGVLDHTATGLTSSAMARNGTRLGGWVISTADNQLQHAGDVDGDGRDEILITSPWGLGILELGAGGLTSLLLHPNGTRFGGWLLNTADNWFPVMADLDGDGCDEIVVTSPWGLGVLKVNGGTLTSLVMAPNGVSFGDWTLDTATDHIEVAADVDGDGRAELVVSGPTKVAVLALQGGVLATVACVTEGTDVGGWTIGATHRFGVAGDLDGDGHDELLVTSDEGLAVLEVAGGALHAITAVTNGTRLGQWLLNTRDNRLNRVADLDGDGRAEVLATSPWGIGVLRLDGGHLTSVAMAPNATRFTDWLLNTDDDDLEAGFGRSYGVLVTHPQWGGAVADTAATLRTRGFTVIETADGNAGIEILRRLARVAGPCDRVFVYLAGHGGSGRALGDRSVAVALGHILQFEDGAIVSYSSFAPSFEHMGDKGADLIVFNGACDAGESVVHATGKRFLALSTTSVYAPGITGVPDPSDVMTLFGKPAHFGLWWSHDNSASILDATVPHRFYQKIYRSDDTAIAFASLFHKPALSIITGVGSSWNLMVNRCYLFHYVYPDDYATLSDADKAACTVALDTYLADEQRDYDAVEPDITELRQTLGHADLVARAADVYAAAYPRPWQSLLGDMSWDVNAEPVRQSPIGTPVEPRLYAGHDGFVRMVADVLRLITALEDARTSQISLLRQIDHVVRSKIFTGVLSTSRFQRVEKITDYLVRNDYEKRDTDRLVQMLDRVPDSRGPLLRAVTPPPGAPAVERPHLDVRRRLRVQDMHFEGNRADGPRTMIELTAPTELDRLAHAFDPHLVEPTLTVLVPRLAAVRAAMAVHVDQLFYTLTIAEEAVSRVQATGAETGDLLSF